MNDTQPCSPSGEYHCAAMAQALSDTRLPVHYSPRFRDYGIIYADGSVQLIYFCPWCGVELPGSLGREWFDRLDAMGLEPGDPSIPPAMLTDQWWKDEKL